MNAPAARCAACGVAVDGAPGAAIAGPVRASVEAGSRGCCDACRRRQGTASATSIGAAVERAIASRLTAGTGRVGHASCGSCGAGLDLPMRATTRMLTVEPSDGPPFTVTVELPLIRCGECALDNVPPELVTSVHRTVREVCGAPTAAPRRLGLLSRLRRRDAPGSLARPSRP